MSTFQELQAELATANFKRTVIQHLITYIDLNFRPIAGSEPKSRLLTDEKVPVPPSIFEDVVSEVLVQVDTELVESITAIMGADVQNPTAEEKPVGKKAKTGTTKSEAKP